MNHTVITYWKTLNGTYYTKADNYADYDKGVGEYRAKFKTMQNDTNVATFTLLLTDEYGNKVKKCSWTRQIATEEPTEEVAQ